MHFVASQTEKLGHMNDAIFIAILIAFAVLSWGFILLCDRLMGGKG
jgi:hypothetical protein